MFLIIVSRGATQKNKLRPVHHLRVLLQSQQKKLRGHR